MDLNIVQLKPLWWGDNKDPAKKAQYLELSKHGASFDFGSITVYWVNRISI